MNIPIYHVDAFSDRPFSGNPAAVCPLDEWLPDAMMQSIATENNLSETVFFVPSQQGFQIRWFTPLVEVNLCGHATLAAAHVLFHCLGYNAKRIRFEAKSGRLHVARDGDLLVMDFPAQMPRLCAAPALLQAVVATAPIATVPIACLKSEDYMVVLGDESDVLAIRPNYSLLKKLDLRGVIVTAASDQYDFVSRFFAPKIGIDEDPVTGSAHSQLAPYWSAQLGRSKLRARQLSARGGDLICEVVGERVMISGNAVTVMQGEIILDAL